MSTFDRPVLPAVVRAMGAVGFAAVCAFVAIGLIGPGDTNAGPNALDLAAAALWSTNPAATETAASRDAREAEATLASTRHAASAERNPGTAATGTGRVDLRCWQDGVLIVNESRVAPAAEPFPYALKFPSKSAGGLPMYLTAFSSATCLIKPVAE